MGLPELDRKTDRFVLDDRAGGGGMGDVYHAVDRETGRAVAVKVLRGSASSVERKRFQREIAVIADLRHPNIVEYIDHGSLPDSRPFFAMEWLDGEDLVQRQRSAPLGMRDAVEVVRRAAQAMAAVHARGVVHRDLKLGNIFLIRSRGVNVKLIDFGVVRMPGEDPAEDKGAILGTPHFMAPEQARGEAVDARADVYSLGAVLFKLLTLRNVFETEHIVALLGRLVIEDPPVASSVRFDVPEAIDRVLLRARSPRRRPIRERR
ncbi:MAG: serine/threonine-protein kinase [Polyangiaceae bacterium]